MTMKKQNSPYGLTRLSLTAFRSYTQLHLQLDTRPVVLTGENGHGKTNLLEAISLLSPGKGFRGANGAHLISRQTPQTAWAISAVLESDKGNNHLGLGLDPDGFARGKEKKIARIDQTNVRGVSQFSNYIQVLWLTPSMDRLLQDSPAERRRFLDRLVYGLDCEHAARVKRYEHTMRERLTLLKEGRAIDAWLSALENTMVETAMDITLARHRTLEKLSEQLQNAATRFPRAHLKITGWLDDLLLEGHSVTDVTQMYRDKLIANRSSDGVIGMTRCGTHRSDLLCFFDDGIQPAAQCSTGEQKAMLLSIILSAARMQHVHKRGVPILLLDEVVAHLDPHRRRDLYDEIEALSLQTWMSGTDSQLFAGFGTRAQHFSVENGIVSPKSVL